MSLRRLLIAVLLMFVAALSQAAGAQSPRSITVSAGDVDRRDVIVPVQISGGPGPVVWTLRDDAGNATALQVGPGGRGRFILGELKAGRSRTYKLERADGAGGDEVQAETDGGALRMRFAGKYLLDYQGEKTDLPEGYERKFHRGGYIHPIYTPAGKQITDDYPPKHKHHHGVWSPWTKTKFEGRAPDFWNMGDLTGTVEFVNLRASWGGPVAGGFVTNHRFVDLGAKPEPKVALNETWNVSVFRPLGSSRPYHVFDLTITQTCASDSPLELPKYHYGGLGFRGHKDWDGKDNATFLTSEGKDRSNGNETRGKWCLVSGKIDGETAGVAILCHPDNFRFPQPMRLHPDEPFFCYCPSQLGDWKIEPGKPYVARYRFVVMDAGPDAKEIERLWNDYANPPKVTVE